MSLDQNGKSCGWIRCLLVSILLVGLVLTGRCQFTFADPIDQPFGLHEYGVPGIIPTYGHVFHDFDHDGLTDCIYLSPPPTDSSSSVYLAMNTGGLPPVFGQPVNVDFEEFEHQFYWGINATPLIDIDGDGFLEIGQFSQENSANFWNDLIIFKKVEMNSVFPPNYIDQSQAVFFAGGACWPGNNGCVERTFLSSNQLLFADMSLDSLSDMLFFTTYYNTEDNDSIIEFVFEFHSNSQDRTWPLIFDRKINNPEWLEELRFVLNNSRQFYPFWNEVYAGDLDGDLDQDLLLGLLSAENPPLFSLYTVENTIDENNEMSGNLHRIWSDTLPFDVDIIDLDLDGDADVLINQTGYLAASFPYLEKRQLVYIENTTVHPTGLIEDEQMALNLTINPNPAHSMTRIEISSASGKPCILEVFDIHGRRVFADNMEHQSHVLRQEDVGTGLFIVRISNGSDFVFGRILFTQ